MAARKPKPFLSGRLRFDRCPGTATHVCQVGLEERGRYPIDKQYRCRECGRWLKVNASDRLPFHLRSDSAFNRAWAALPDCVPVDPVAARTIADLRWACRIQLDLIQEGQDGTDADDAGAIRRWLQRHGEA